MSDAMIILSEAGKAHLARIGRKAISLSLGDIGVSYGKPAVNSFKNPLPVRGIPKSKPFQNARSSPERIPVTRIVEENDVSPLTVPAINNQEIELTKEECFCCTMNVLLDEMSKTDKAAKEAAKSLLIVMENEAGSTVSLLVYNCYVRKYNALREQYFLSAAANLKAKTIRISSDIIESLEQMAKTVKIEISSVNLHGFVR